MTSAWGVSSIITSARSAPIRNSAVDNWTPNKSEQLNIITLASKNVNPISMMVRATSEVDVSDVSDRVNRVHSVSSSMLSESVSDQQVSVGRQKSLKKYEACYSKGNHYALSKIVDYLQTRTLASYFTNPTKEDMMKSSGLANVTKSLMAASVVHLGGNYDRHADSYLRGLRRGLNYASHRHDNQQDEEMPLYGCREPRTKVPRDLMEVYYGKRKRGGSNHPRLRLSYGNWRRPFGIRQHKREVFHRDSGEGGESCVQLCSFEELKQLLALSDLSRTSSRFRLTPRRRPAASVFARTKGDGEQRKRAKQRAKKRKRNAPDVAGVAPVSPRVRKILNSKGKPRKKKKGGPSKRR